jgi:glycerophosphoryl diester phosphodiesterase
MVTGDGSGPVDLGNLSPMTTSPLGPGPLVYAHRGDRSRAKDNTLEAYSLAVEAGADGVELDVRRTRDGVLIVSHDDRYEHLGAFSSLDFDALRELAPQVPTLREAMGAIPRNVFVNVEIKNFPTDAGFDADRHLVNETVAELRSYDDPKRILLSSFDPISMQRAGTIGPEFLRGLLVLADVPFSAGLATAQELAVDAINPCFSHVGDDATGVMEEIRSAQLAAVVWRVDKPSEITAMAEAEVDVIITDDPGMAQEIVRQR